MSRIDPKFQSVIDKELKPNESICWSTMPNALSRACDSIGVFLFGIPWNAGLLYFISPIVQKPQFPPFHFILLLSPFIFFGICLFFSPLFAYIKAHKTLYVITNKRAFTLSVGKTHSIENFYPKKSSILKKIERKNGTGDIILKRSHHTDSDGDKQTTDYGFFSLPDVADAERNLDMLLNNS
ncbi:hypothetical protein O1B71_003472 [Vibrio cholerae]|nr:MULTISPECIES: hypothetical protein [Vibrio]EKF9231078.1 hypothetical protein [Vibrio cholerae]